MPKNSPPRRRTRARVGTDSTPPCVFQRLLIIHYRLPEICIDGGLDEGASLEELSENILYYHRDEKMNSMNTGVDTTQDDSPTIGDAIQFAGLCSALLSLPEAIAGSEYCTDETRLVHLDTCTLVFVPLEQGCGIMAIAQVERASPFNNPSPLAVKRSIETCHELFCLLRGSIHYHLSRTSPEVVDGMNAKPTNNNIVQSTLMNILLSKDGVQKQDDYPGMTELYNIRKQVRKLKRDLSRSNDADKQSELDDSIAKLDERLTLLEEALPIHALRYQLKTHYDEYIADASVVSSATGVMHCNLVENVPACIAKSDDALVCEYQPTTASSASVMEKMKDAVQKSLDNATENADSNEPQLVGISVFQNCEFISSHTPSSDDSLQISSQSACLLMEHMASYKFKIALHAKQHCGLPSTKSGAVPPKRLGGLRRFLSSSFMDEDSSVTVDPDVSILSENHGDRAQFLAPPPLSMLNVTDRVLQVSLPSHGNVWTPNVFLPLGNRAGTLKANLVLLDIGEFNFLLYLKTGESLLDGKDVTLVPSLPGSDLNEEEATESVQQQGLDLASSAVIKIPVYSRLLGKTLGDLANVVDSARDNEGIETTQEKSNPFAECGQYVIFIDRLTQRVVIHSCSKGVQKRKRSVDKNGIFELQALSVDPSSNVDRRHIFVSKLPLNVVEAFDDLISQINERMAYSDGEILQMCTYMSKGWVFAHAQDQKELYMFFDASKFVTVSDVQHAADRVRRELFNDPMS